MNWAQILFTFVGIEALAFGICWICIDDRDDTLDAWLTVNGIIGGGIALVSGLGYFGPILWAALGAL